MSLLTRGEWIEIPVAPERDPVTVSLLTRGEWIEILSIK